MRRINMSGAAFTTSTDTGAHSRARRVAVHVWHLASEGSSVLSLCGRRRLDAERLRIRLDSLVYKRFTVKHGRRMYARAAEDAAEHGLVATVDLLTDELRPPIAAPKAPGARKRRKAAGKDKYACSTCGATGHTAPTHDMFAAAAGRGGKKRRRAGANCGAFDMARMGLIVISS